MFKYFLYSLVLLASFLSNTVFAATASWYGPGFDGKKTASGERYNQNQLTAAHKTLPFHTQVCITNLSNGKTVKVRITDRGPYIKGRLFDVSKAAANELGFTKQGTCKITYKICD